MSVNLTKTLSGLLVQDNFQATSGWNNDGNWQTVSDPALVSFDPLPLSFMGTGNSFDCVGVREPMPYRESDSAWYQFYDAGDQKNGWSSFWALSNDRGLTWKKAGQLPSGYSRGDGGIDWKATALGWVEKRGNIYFLHRVLADNYFPYPNVGLPGGPYLGDVWSSTNLSGPWVYVRTLQKTPGTWTEYENLPGSLVKNGDVYHFFTQGSGPGVVNYQIGRMYSSTAGGPYTLDPVAIASREDFDGWSPENPKVFFHAGLNKWVMLINLIHPSGTYTDRNAVLLSDSVEDWSNFSYRISQRTCPLDGLNAIGVQCHITGPDGESVQSQNGFLPFQWDSTPQRYETHGWHLGRSIKNGVYEPSTHVLMYNGSGSGKYFRILGQSDLVCEFGIQFPSNITGKKIGFLYRCDSSASNGYAIFINCGGHLSFEKLNNGVFSQLFNATTGLSTLREMIHRIKIIVSADRHIAYIDGEKQVDFSDATYSGGTTIGFIGNAAAGTTIRNFSVRKGNSIVVHGLSPGQNIVLRAAGGLPVMATVANKFGDAVLTHTHFPLESLEVGNIDYKPAEGIWGGDEYSFAGLPSTPKLSSLRGGGGSLITF